MKDKDKTKEQLIKEQVELHQQIKELKSSEIKHRQTEKSLREKTKLNQILLDSLPCVALLMRPHTRQIVASNKYALKVKAVPGAQCFSTFGQRDDPCPWCLAPKVWDTGKPQHLEVEALGVAWDAYWLPVEEDLYMHYAFDVTERKQMQEKLLQSEKLKSLGELAGGVAHDFNNVLAAILGRAQLLKMIFEPPQGKEERRSSMIELNESLEVIEQASRDGAETVRRIQEFARRRDDDKHFGTVDLNEIIDNALDFTRMKWKDDAESKGIKINIQKEFSTLPATSGSASELREVFTNLINNAVDAMPQGGEIKIKTYIEDGGIVVNVADTGVGIADDRKAKIFDPFFTTKGVQSSGLGMSVSHGIIRRHRGTIEVDSTEGQGTTFTIKLPVRVKPAEEGKVKPISGEIKKARILVIEDEAWVRSLLFKILKRVGHEVETATSGDQGIEMFEKNEFDLVFTDLGMPGMSGWQVAEKVKGLNGRVPVVLITGWDIRQEESEMQDSYVDLIVHKPFEVEQVLNLVQEGMILRERFKAI